MRNIKPNAKFSRIHIEMIRAIVTFALNAANVAVTNSIAAFAALIDRLKINLIAIDNLEQIANTPVTGYAAMKKALRDALTEMSVAIMQSVYSFAIDTNNEVLAAQMKTSRSAMKNMNYVDFMAFVGQAITNVNGVIGSLVPYNILPATVTAWTNNRTQLQNVLADPKNAHGNIDAVKKDIQNLLRASMIMLYNQCDTIAPQFKESNTNYYNQYRSNRKLQPLTKHTKFRVTVTDELNQPVYNVKVQQDGTPVIEFTNMDGQATMYVKVNEGTDAQPVYSFTLTSGTNTHSSGNIEIKKGHTVSRSYIMQPSGFIIPAPVDENTNVNVFPS